MFNSDLWSESCFEYPDFVLHKRKIPSIFFGTDFSARCCKMFHLFYCFYYILFRYVIHEYYLVLNPLIHFLEIFHLHAYIFLPNSPIISLSLYIYYQYNCLYSIFYFSIYISLFSSISHTHSFLPFHLVKFAFTGKCKYSRPT